MLSLILKLCLSSLSGVQNQSLIPPPRRLADEHSPNSQEFHICFTSIDRSPAPAAPYIEKADSPPIASVPEAVGLNSHLQRLSREARQRSIELRLEEAPCVRTHSSIEVEKPDWVTCAGAFSATVPRKNVSAGPPERWLERFWQQRSLNCVKAASLWAPLDSFLRFLI